MFLLLLGPFNTSYFEKNGNILVGKNLKYLNVYTKMQQGWYSSPDDNVQQMFERWRCFLKGAKVEMATMVRVSTRWQ